MEPKIIIEIAQTIVMTLCLIMYGINLWNFIQTKDTSWGIWAIIYLVTLYGVMGL